MKTLLLTRLSPFQIYCANVLHTKGILSAMVIEMGSSVPPENITRRISIKKCTQWIIRFASQPRLAVNRIHNLLNHKRYYGQRTYHDKRILRSDFDELCTNLPRYRFDDINDERAVKWMREYDPPLAFVFGTRLIKQHILDVAESTFVNMHWGWSPDYRGEGIVSALANGGAKELGVTVHLLDRNADAGDILYREKPQIDPEDNFYSIGLKLTVLGTQLFMRVLEDFKKRGNLLGIKQDLSVGRVYSSSYLRDHPEVFHRAWRNLKADQARLAS